jgi:hypothetical protein
MHAPRMLFVGFVFLTMNFWHATGCDAQTPDPAPLSASAIPAAPAANPAVTPAKSATPIAPATQTDSGEIAILKAQIAALNQVLDQMQKVDSKIANIAPWIAAAIAFVTAFVAIMPILFLVYEWSVRRANEKKFDEYRTDLRPRSTGK